MQKHFCGSGKNFTVVVNAATTLSSVVAKIGKKHCASTRMGMLEKENSIHAKEFKKYCESRNDATKCPFNLHAIKVRKYYIITHCVLTDHNKPNQAYTFSATLPACVRSCKYPFLIPLLLTRTKIKSYTH